MAVLIPDCLIERNLAFEDIIDSITVILRLERGSFGNELVDKDSQSPHINSLIVASACEHLWGPIERSSSECKHLLVAAPLMELTTYSKID